MSEFWWHQTRQQLFLHYTTNDAPQSLTWLTHALAHLLAMLLAECLVVAAANADEAADVTAPGQAGDAYLRGQDRQSLQHGLEVQGYRSYGTAPS